MRLFTKSFLVLLAALFSFSMAFAETGTETEADQKNGNKNTTAEGQSYTIDGAYIAGTGSSSASPMTSKGLKFRTGVNGGTLEFTVRENYTITKLYIAAVGNYAADDSTIPYVKVSKVEVDGAEVEFVGGEFPEKGVSEAGELTIDNITAKEKIVLYFDNSNASAGTQLNASWAIDWSRPDATQPTITVTPETVALVPGATYQLNAHVDPNSFTTQWVSSNEAVATVDESGLVTAVAAGTATISHQWADDASVASAAVITVADFNPLAFTLTSYDFTAMGDVALSKGESAGNIWNEANSKANEVFWCTNEGLELLAIQQYFEEAKANTGWKIVDGEGLFLGGGAGRCAAIGGIKAGQIVEFIYTGNHFYTNSTDDGISKTAINEGVGRAIFMANEDGMIGFELDKGNYVTQINIYSSSGMATTKTIGLMPGVWDKDGAIFAAYAWNDEGNAWFPFVEVSGAYGTQIPDSYTGILLARINPGASVTDPWNTYVWNQTDDIDFTAIADGTVFIITDWGPEGGKSPYTTSAPIDLDAVKAQLAEAIVKAKALNAYANDDALAAAITAAEAAVAGDDAAAIVAAAKGLEAAAIKAAKDVLQKIVNLAKIIGIDTTDVEALLANEEATVEQLATALQTMLDGLKDKAIDVVAMAKAFFNQFDSEAAAALEPYFAVAETALAGDDYNAMHDAAMALATKCLEVGKNAMLKVDSYLRKMGDDTINADLDAVKAAIASISDPTEILGLISVIQKLKDDMTPAVMTYLAGVETLIKDGTAAGKDVAAMQAAYVNVLTLAVSYNAGTATLVEMGTALYELIKAVEAYKEANTFYTVAGTKDLTGTENDWDIVEANNMTLDTETGLYTWTAENITVTADVNPAFKVVKTDLEGQTWYPEGDASTNWVINADVTGKEGVFNITIFFNAETNYISVEPKEAGVAEDIAIYPTGGDIAAALEEAKAKVDKVGDITINLAVDGVYTLGATLTAPNNIFVYGNEATVTVDEEMTGDFITLNGTEIFAMKSETEASDHYLIPSVEVRGLNLKGLKGALVKDAQKTLVEDLVIDWSNIEMPAAGKNVLDFNGKGYAGKVTVTNSTIWANGMNTGFFAQYGSRPKNINGDWLQEFDFENNTIVNIANGKNFNDLKQNGTAQNVYTLKNNIFVDCGKSGQTVVGFNKGQTSATPVWDVTGNYFEAAGACTNAAETEKAGKQGEEDIVKNCVEGVLTFTDAANGDFNGEFELAEGAEAPTALGAPYWTITFQTATIADGYYLVGNMNEWTPSKEYKLTLNEAAEGVEEYMITLDLAADAQLKVMKVEGENQTYYPAGTGNAYGENGELPAAGEYTVYFRPNADGGDDWFNKVIYVAPTTTDGISTITIDTQNAVVYDMQGRRVHKTQKGLYIVNGKKVVLK